MEDMGVRKNFKSGELHGANTVLVTGYAPGPRGTAVHHEYNYLGVIMEIDLESDIIIDVEFTFVTNLAREFFSRLVQGYSLSNGPDELYSRIRSKFWTPSTEAIVACVKVAAQRYLDTKKTAYKSNEDV